MSWFLYCSGNIHACLFMYPLLSLCRSVCYPRVSDKGFCLIRQTKTCSFVLLKFCFCLERAMRESEDCSSTRFNQFMVYQFHEYRVWGAAIGSSHRSALTRPSWNGGPSRPLVFCLCPRAFVWRHRCCCLQVWFVSPDWHVKRILNKQQH